MAKRRDEASAALDLQVVKALSHPLRVRLLERLNAGEASPVEMARELGETVGRVSHHVRTLARVGAIELVRTEQRRGAVEHFYRATTPAWFSDADWKRVPEPARRAIVAHGLNAVVEDIATAAATGFDWPEMHVSRTRLALDSAALEEVRDLLNATLARIVTIQEESRRRGAEPAAETEAILLHFEWPGG